MWPAVCVFGRRQGGKERGRRPRGESERERTIFRLFPSSSLVLLLFFFLLHELFSVRSPLFVAFSKNLSALPSLQSLSLPWYFTNLRVFPAHPLCSLHPSVFPPPMLMTPIQGDPTHV